MACGGWAGRAFRIWTIKELRILIYPCGCMLWSQNKLYHLLWVVDWWCEIGARPSLSAQAREEKGGALAACKKFGCPVCLGLR